MKAILVAVVLAGCAFAFAIGVARADDGSAVRQTAPVTQPVQQDVQQQDEQRPRDDCPEKGGSGESGSQEGSSGSSSSEQQF